MLPSAANSSKAQHACYQGRVCIMDNAHLAIEDERPPSPPAPAVSSRPGPHTWGRHT